MLQLFIYIYDQDTQLFSDAYEAACDELQDRYRLHGSDLGTLVSPPVRGISLALRGWAARSTTPHSIRYIAQSGQCSSIGDIRNALRLEGFSAAQIEGPLLRKQLRKLISEALTKPPRDVRSECGLRSVARLKLAYFLFRFISCCSFFRSSSIFSMRLFGISPTSFSKISRNRGAAFF